MERQYMLTQAYFEPTPSEVKALVIEAADLHDTVDDKGTSWLDRTRAGERLKTVERLIQTARAVHRRAEQQQAEQVQQVRPTLLQNTASCPGGRYELSDGGDAYLWIANNGEPKIAEPQFAESVPYWRGRR